MCWLNSTWTHSCAHILSWRWPWQAGWSTLAAGVKGWFCGSGRSPVCQMQSCLSWVEGQRRRTEAQITTGLHSPLIAPPAGQRGNNLTLNSKMYVVTTSISCLHNSTKRRKTTTVISKVQSLAHFVVVICFVYSNYVQLCVISQSGILSSLCIHSARAYVATVASCWC